jgi:ribosomal protein L11 methylase PrmA
MILPGSFRDPSGFLFFHNGILYRQINDEYQDHFNRLIDSGLYEKLSTNRLIIPHLDVEIPPQNPERAFKVIKPSPIPFISYPYEWAFSQLKHAALLTLEIQKISLEFGMTLKDASAYNVQFLHGKPIFIDTLSFEIHQPKKPWTGYRQFCRHFLAPLALMQYTDIRLGQMLRTDLDGIPLDLTSRLLPKKTWLNLGIVMHIHLHAKSEKKYADVHVPLKSKEVSKNALLGLLDNLTSTIEKMQWQPQGTEWVGYYLDTNYSKEEFERKKEIVSYFMELAQPEYVWDIGANTGLFSRLASTNKITTIAFDRDPACVELNYRQIVQNDEQFLLPLLLDLTNPSPGIGWQNEERDSLIGRGPADTVLCLALVHHLAIANNVPLDRIAEFFSRIGNSLIIEFVPKSDTQVQKLLMNRHDIFRDYTEEHFEKAFSTYFDILNKEPLKPTFRILYFMKKKVKPFGS